MKDLQWVAELRCIVGDFSRIVGLDSSTNTLISFRKYK